MKGWKKGYRGRDEKGRFGRGDDIPHLAWHAAFHRCLYFAFGVVSAVQMLTR